MGCWQRGSNLGPLGVNREPLASAKQVCSSHRHNDCSVWHRCQEETTWSGYGFEPQESKALLVVPQALLCTWGRPGSWEPSTETAQNIHAAKALPSPYPRAALKGQPMMAPAATPSTAMEVLSIYQPVMAITVVYMQKLLGRKAAKQGKEGVSQAFMAVKHCIKANLRL